MKPKQKEKMFYAMQAAEDPDAPDGAWQAILEDVAEMWGEENGIEVYGFDAFMEYLSWSREEVKK